MPPTAPSPDASLWSMQVSLMARGRGISANLAKSLSPTAGFGAAVHRMLRAAFLDPDVYRESASNAALTTEAALSLAAALLCAATGPMFFSMVTGGLGLSWVLPLLAVQAASLAAFVLGAAYSAPFVIQKRAAPMELFRPIAYAQSVGLLGIIPVVGPFLSLWRIVTTTAAIKDSLGVDTGKAVTLFIVGVVCGMVASAVVGPMLFGSIGGFGGFYR